MRIRKWLAVALSLVMLLGMLPFSALAEDTGECPAGGQHNWEGRYDPEPQCVVTGTMHYTCTKCGTERFEPVPALEHAWSDWTVLQEAACAAEGRKVHTCSRCGATEEATIPVIGHYWHEQVNEKAATCTTAGYKEYYYVCSTCGATETDEDQQKEEIPALGHKWSEWTTTQEPTCEEKGKRSRKCSRCGNTESTSLAALGHEWDEGEITLEPTPEKPGEKTYTCKRDPSHQYTEEIPYSGETVPETDPETDPESEPEPTPDETTETTEPTADSCVKVLKGMGDYTLEEELQYCVLHSLVADQITALTADTADAEKGWAEAADLWRDALAKEYDELGAANETAQQAIQDEKAAYETYLMSLTVLLQAVYPDDPALVNQRLSIVLEKQCTGLCFLHANAGKGLLSEDYTVIEGDAPADKCQVTESLTDEGKLLLHIALCAEHTKQENWQKTFEQTLNAKYRAAGDGARLAIDQYQTAFNELVEKDKAMLDSLTALNPDVSEEIISLMYCDQVLMLCEIF